jgi:peptidoglycan lytic transglycosylase
VLQQERKSMSAAVGALQFRVRPPFWILALAAIAGMYAVASLNIFSEAMRESAAPPAPPLERSKRAPAKLPPIPSRNETRRATPPPRTETAKIEPTKPNAKIGTLPATSIARIEPVQPDAKISALPKKSKAAKAAAKKHAARRRALPATVPSLPLRNDWRFAGPSPPSKPNAATMANLPPLPLRNEKRQAETAAKSKTAATEPTAQPRGKSAKPQTGKASWYDFHGQTTANGETMDRGALTAAHKTLPLGSKAVVENLDNGREVEVHINDRGPFVGGRIIDLSKEAAEQIDMLGDGVAKVIVKPAEAASGGQAKR